MMLAELRSPHGSLSRKIPRASLSRELHTPGLLRTHVPVEYLLQKTGFCYMVYINIQNSYLRDITSHVE